MDGCFRCLRRREISEDVKSSEVLCHHGWCKRSGRVRGYRIYRFGRCPVTISALVISLLLHITSVHSQTTSDRLRSFPPLFNAAENRPVITEPSQSTCGYPERNAYCKSSTIVESLEVCNHGFCVQTCPVNRNNLPSHQNLLDTSSSGSGSCIEIDTVNVRPGSSGETSTFFSQTGPTCFLTPRGTLTLGSNGTFTLTVWIWQEANNDGVILEKFSQDSEITLRLQVSQSQVTLFYRSLTGLSGVNLNETIPSRIWTHLAVQVYGRSVSFFLNGVHAGFSPVLAETLSSVIQDKVGQVRVGQSAQGSLQFLGRLQDFRFYSETLSNREIQLVYSGTFPPVRIQSSCRCPPSHPRIRPTQTHYCIRNGEPDNTGNQILRLNTDAHPVEYINDGDSNSIWISRFQDQVTLTIDLGDVFQVFYVVLQFYSPLPKGVTMEKQANNSSAWETWQMYADDCPTRFNMTNNGPLPNPTAVNCLQFGIPSLPLPASKGNITFNVLSPEPVPRPGYNDFYNAQGLYDFVAASKVRVQLDEHFNVTETRHMYHGLFELIISARCQCNGHAPTCDTNTLPYRCNCLVLSHTEGNKCERCQPLFNDKPFRRGNPITAYHCKECQCYGHADSCVYNRSVDPFPDEHSRGGGGVCVACRHNTVGRNCDTCAVNYFRPEGVSLYSENVCEPCACNSSGVADVTRECAKVGGLCPCKPNVEGRTCDTCKPGYYNLEQNNPSGCTPCECNTAGTTGQDQTCHQSTGQCNCKPNVRNLQCNACDYGYYNLNATLPEGCLPCNCDPRGSNNTFCDPGEGQCFCKPNVVGRRCDRCADGYFNFEAGCVACDCDLQGTAPGTTCNKSSGHCVCKGNTQGARCDQCSDGAYSFGSSSALGCISCNCDSAGTKPGASICDKVSGLCDCKDNVVGQGCNQCKGSTWGLNLTNPVGCQQCDCDPSGTQSGAQVPVNELTCNQNSGQCTCLTNRQGRRCDSCVPGYYATQSAGTGCVACQCNPRGSLPGTVCDGQSGQCQCRTGDSGVTGLSCDTCLPTYYNFDQGTGRCTACNCHPAGSLNDTCNSVTGQCDCKQFVQGLQCASCVPEASVLDINNPYGCSKAPAQQPPPQHVPISPTVLQLSWLPPDYPNGVIKAYNVYRNGVQVASVVSNESRVFHNDTGLTPFTEYSYVIEAVNDFGSVRSEPITFITAAGVPGGALTLQVSNRGSRTADFRWNVPSQPNGQILKYVLKASTDMDPNVTAVLWEGLATFQTLRNLTPFTGYTVRVEACTTAGCLQSQPVMFSTLSALAEGQDAPTITPVSSTELFVTWDPPRFPNGIISFYELWMRKAALPGSPPLEATRIFYPSGQYNPRPTQEPEENALPPPQTNYSVTGLDPYTPYQFQVLSQNDAGKTPSPWATGRTLEAAPLSTPAPVIIPLSSQRMNVTWAPPADKDARGLIVSFSLYQYKATDPLTNPFSPPFTWQLIIHLGGNVNHFVVTELRPYTVYRFYVQACNSIGCVRSVDEAGRTLAAAPEGLSKPTVEGLNSSAMEITWLPPEFPNGPAPVYKVERTSTALNYPSRVVRGTRFPGEGFYRFPPDTIPQNVGFTGIQFWFRTFATKGLLFFSASDGQQEEFILIQFVAGRPRFVFDPQACLQVVELAGLADNITFDDGTWHKLVATRIGSQGRLLLDNTLSGLSLSGGIGCPSIAQPTNDEGLPYNRGKWHHLIARRNGKSGSIVIDNTYSGQAVIRCDQGNVIGTNTGVYIGGLDPNFQLRRDFGAQDRRAALVDRGFRGCIRDMKILKQVSPVELWEDLDWQTAEVHEQAFPNWEGCPMNLEQGMHFMGRGFAALSASTFDGGNVFSISVTFRTELSSGLLFFAHGGQGIFVLAEIRDGSLFMEVGNGQKRQSVTYPRTAAVNFCDGQWRRVTFSKDGEQVNVTVRDQRSQLAGNPAVSMELITVSPLYVGGVHAGSEAEVFLRDNRIQAAGGYGGCLSDVSVNGEMLTDIVQQVKELLNVNLDGCPQYQTPAVTCQSSLEQEIYSGTENRTVDSGLQPYTEYLYRVTAENSAGSGSSPWRNGKTREEAPERVSAPNSAVSPEGHVIQVVWPNPTDSPGLLTRLALRAYNNQSPGEGVIEANITDTSSRNGTITDVIPFTNYTVRLVACTSGGCTESEQGVTVLTREEAPEGIPAPTAEAGPTYLAVRWSPPGRLNGIITGYILFMNSAEVYSGGETSFNVTGLQVYTGYIFYVKACTKQGCASGPTADLTTAQLPPSFMQPPILQALGTSQVEARWSSPDQLNGVLERYQLYVSVDQSVIGELVYNNSDLFLTYVIPNLNAGTTYFIRAAACTGGGCRMSAPSNVTTEESAPEGVPDPVVTSPGPTSLVVTWGLPELPNGVIVKYELFHNGLKVFDTPNRREYTIDNLLPYSVHAFRVSACTVKGCGMSRVVEARTQEDAPRGFVNIVDLQVKDARTIQLQWSPPDTPNGLLYYDVYFTGLFYVDPGNWNYNVSEERRSLYRNTTANSPVLIEGLIPYSSYSIQVNASNTKGFLLSGIRPVDMPQGSPDGVQPPVLLSPSPTSIQAIWQTVGRDNADTPPSYRLQMRPTTPGAIATDVFGPTTSTTHTVEGLKPFTEYELRLVAENRIGRTLSTWEAMYTKQAEPTSLDPPRIISVMSNHIDLEWNAPLEPNGILTEYMIYQNTVLRQSVSANETSLRADGLEANTLYTFRLAACTVAGCKLSGDSSTVRTLQAAPQSIPAPSLTSPTPASVQVVWAEPAKPNGIIRQYTIERRLKGDNSTVVVTTQSVLVATVYTDSSPELNPFTAYEYRILATNDVGTGAGPWAEIITASSRPGSMRAPTVTVLGPRSLEVRWQEPIRPNGELEYYSLYVPPLPRQTYNTTQRVAVLYDFVPYTKYTVSVAACTAGGCTESAGVTVQTQPATPDGLLPPLPIPISQTMITITWEPPFYPNGPNIRYELARRMVRRPLQPSSSTVGLWSSLYTGNQTYYEDRGLTLFTFYQYRVTVSNSVGQLTSSPSNEVSTFGGVPQRPADVSVRTIDHMSLLVNWTTPSVIELQGAVEIFTLVYTSNTGTGSTVLGPGADNTTLTGLTPNTQYSITLTISIIGGATITSPAVNATTMDGAPEGLSPPQLIPLSDYSLQVVWSAPDKPNGQVTGYYIYLDDQKITTNQTTAGSYVITNLQPYTVYFIQMEVCTVHDCVRSNVTRGTTAEARPQGVTPPNLVTRGPNTIDVTWLTPENPNGIILTYDITRVTMVPCSEIEEPTVPPPSNTCTYLSCDRQESVCGTVCYSGPKVCCDGVVHDAQPSHECCGRSYIPARSAPDDVCCGGRFHRRRDNYQCCGNRYLAVSPGQVCCVDVTQDRVAVGYGDSCCGTLPHTSSGAQICCAGSLHSRYGQQCCGDEVVSEDRTCCGNLTHGQSYAPGSGYRCCGTDYIQEDRHLCCVTSTGQAKVHSYSNSSMKASSNQKCCGLELISVGLSCCNYRGYNPAVQVCADRTEQGTGCGSGTLCPISQTNSAFCDQCDFDRGNEVCSVVQRSSPSLPVTSSAEEINTGDCEVDKQIIYTGLGLSYTDGGLSPYTRYKYSVTVTNSAGRTQSDFASTLTSQSVPQGLTPPMYKVFPDRLYVIYLTWAKPAQPNGEIIRYSLTRDGQERYRGLELQFSDDNTILPYRSYTYVLSACTVVGCTQSDPISVATAQAPPENILPPRVSVLSATTIRLEWSPPDVFNGLITQYSVLMNGAEPIVNTTGLEHIVRGLAPFTEYSFAIRVCTRAGCTDSSNVTAVTLQARPQGVKPPRFLIISSTVVLIFWSPPGFLNGEITGYRLFRTTSGKTVVGYSGGATTLMITQSSLIPGATYTFVLEVTNGGGASNSSSTVIDMPVITPLNIPPPKTVHVLGPTSISVTWNDLQNITREQTQRDIDQYRVVINGGSETEMEISVGLNLSAEVRGLQPYTEYSVRIRVCLHGVANGCGTGPDLKAITEEDTPSGLGAPLITPLGPDVVDISWEMPSKPNGIIQQYRIHQRPVGTTTDILINQVDNTTFSFRHAGNDLQPFSEYEYKVTAINRMGQTESAWSKVRTLEAPPIGIQEPIVNVMGAYGMQVTWTEPRNPNGVIMTYDIQYVYLSSDPTISNPVAMVTVDGRRRSAVISGLQPFTRYEVRVAANNSAGSAVSNWVPIQTGEASPSGLGSFLVEKMTNGEAVILRWGMPAKPNGVITTYRVYEGDSEVAVYQGLNREFEFRRLQPYTEYMVRLEACTSAGCTQAPTQTFRTAEILPAAQQPPSLGAVNATNVVLTWSKPLNPNGRILSYEVLRRTVARRRKRQAAEAIVVFKTTDTDRDSYQFVDSGLRPNTKYQYKIKAYNSIGSSDSPWITVDTHEAPPTGMRPPIVDYVSDDVHSLFITWSSPEQANGVLLSYRLQRNESVPPWSFTPSDSLQFTDTNLQAYTVYSYTVTACTSGGCTQSLPTVLRTKETAPLLTLPPVLQPINSTAIKATWQQPEIANGEITQYRLTRDGQLEYTGLLREFVSKGLTPYQEYEYRLTACTNGGCRDSAPVQGRPLGAPPSGMNQPLLRVLSAASIEVSWGPPQNPNGVITSYDVRRNNSLVYTESLAIAGILRTAYTDYNLAAGVKYSYTVTASSSEGSVTSPVAIAETYSSSPSGIQPPELVPLTAYSIQASWAAPDVANGDLYNYTLYLGNEVKYSGPIDRLMYVVPSLQPWMDYTFRIQVCTNRGCELSAPATARTLEAAPENQSPPQLVASADFSGRHNGVRLTWVPPDNPNGEITHYVVLRQPLTKSDTGGNQYGEVTQVFNGSRLEYFDNDPLMRPYTFYRYMVTAYNRVGSTPSLWREVFTKEAPPQGVPIPQILNVTSRTVTVQMTPPVQPNGVIVEYNVRVNGTVRSRGSDTSLVQTAGDSNPLLPYTTYLVQAEVCTRPGCTLSDAVVTQTTEATPTGLDPIIIGEVTSTSVKLSWTPPKFPNGPISRYLVYQRPGCPRSPQVFLQPCVTEDAVQVYSGPDLEFTATDLVPYTTYDFQVRVENTQGLGDFAKWVNTQTKTAVPAYYKLPKLSKNGTRAVIDWTSSFHLNSRLESYTLTADDQKVMEGILSVYSMERTLRDATIKFKIVAKTETGTATSPDIIFDPNAVDNIATIEPPVTGGQTGGSPVYQEVWFIILMCVIALLLLFIILAFCIKRMTRPRPYVRERLPLEPRQKKADYSHDPYNGSVMPEDFPTRPASEVRTTQGEFGVINPAFTNPTMQPLTLETDDLDLTLDNISKMSKYDEDDISWGKPQDSGLYEDDLDSLNAPSYSITKEQTIFTDTHL